MLKPEEPLKGPDFPQAADDLTRTTPLAETRFAHYEIDTRDDGSFVELGRGAMGITFRAQDTTLRCAVALKVVNPKLIGNLRARARFLREARAAAGLRHPHVASVLFFGELAEDRQPFYAMELVEGETLHARVRRCGGLPAAAVLDIGAQVADALTAAEARGVTHRDLKPANLMLVAGEKIHIKVIDFGLAKAAAEDPDGIADLTGVVDFVGTPAFASPEQFNVWQELDARSDFFALGATLWYALTGRAPFCGRTLDELRGRQLDGVLPLDQLRAARVPRPLVDLLRSLLSPDPAGRPQTAEALAAALADCRRQLARRTPARWRDSVFALVVVAGLLPAAVLVGWWSLSGRHTAAVALPTAPEKSVAVLPFDNRTEGKDNAYFAAGVQDEILTDLAKVADLKVISRASVTQYRSGAPRDLREIGTALGVANLLEGSVQRAGNKVRVSAWLIDARTGTQLWAEKYDRDLADVFAIQSDIAQAITDQLQVRLSPSEKAAVQARPTSDLVAYDLYLRAKQLSEESAHRNTEARKAEPEIVRLLNGALARDPQFIEALCLLIRIHETAHWYNFDPSPARAALAEDTLSQAIRMQPDAGEVHLARAIHIYHQYDYAIALRELDLAARTLPNDSDIFLYRGAIYRRQGHWEESVREHQKGLAINPRDRTLLNELSITELGLHRFEDAKLTYDCLLTIAPRDAYLRADRLKLDLYSRADPRVAEASIPSLLAENPEAAEGAAGQAIELALCIRDPGLAARALAGTPAAEITNDMLAQDFPREYFAGLIASLDGDQPRAQAAFSQARSIVGKEIADTPDNAVRLIILGTIDAALGRKTDAIAEGERSVQVLRQASDNFLLPYCTTLLAVIYANTGEKEKALDRLGEVVNKPGNAYYGFLKLHPLWDPLRGDPRFEALVRAAAPPDSGRAAAP